LKAARLLHQHALPLLICVADSDHEAIRHPPNELALVERDRDKLNARRIQAFAEKIQPSLFDSVQSPFVDLPAHGLSQRDLALVLPSLICSHNSFAPARNRTPLRRIVATRSRPAARPNMAEIVGSVPGYAPYLSGTSGG